MAVTVNSSFVGVDANQCRPGAYTLTSTIQGVARDQHCVYEEITGVRTPGAASALDATAHVHDGTSGALLRYPLSQGYLGLTMTRMPVNSSELGNAGWAPVLYVPTLVPTGISRVRLVLWAEADYTQSLRAQVWAESVDPVLSAGDELEEPAVGVWHPPAIDHWTNTEAMGSIVFDLAVVGGEFNVVRLDAFDGFFDPSSGGQVYGQPLPMTRTIYGYAVLPMERRPSIPPEHALPTFTTTTTSVPADLLSHDNALIADDRGVSSVLCGRLNRNNAALWELLTGQPAANRSSSTRTGHRHYAYGSTDIDQSGALVDFPLLSVPYGVDRRLSSGDGDHNTDDEAAAPDAINPWWGIRLFAPAVDGSKTTYGLDLRHRFRCPRHLPATLAHSSGKVEAAVLVRKQTTDSTTVSVQTGDTTYQAGTQGTAGTATSTTGGLQILRISGLDLDRQTGLTVLAGDVCTVALGVTTTPATDLVISILGVALGIIP